MKIKNFYLITLFILLLSNSSIAQTDTSFYGKVVQYLNYHAKKDTSSSFIFNEMGDSIKVDTIKCYYTYGKYTSKYNKSYYIYFNGKIYKEMTYYKNHLRIEDFYTQGIKTKKIVYSDKHPYFMEKIFYFSEDRRYKTEIYNKKGELIKEINE